MIYVATITSKMVFHLARKAQIALLQVEKALVIFPVEYSDFAYIFFEKLGMVLLENIKINTHAIDLK